MSRQSRKNSVAPGTRSTDFGQLQPKQIPPLNWPGEQFGMTWVPNRQKLRRLPKDFCLPIRVCHASEARLVRPAVALFQLVELASVGGLAILNASLKLEQPQRQSYRLMSLIYRWSQSSRRLHARRITRLEDLELTRADRSSVGQDSVLPDELTVERGGRCRVMTPAELVEAGQDFADERGLKRRSVPLLIDYGLLSTALKSPATREITPTEAEKWIRFSLFGFEANTPLEDAAAMDSLEERVIGIFDKHLDDRTEKFEAWMKDVSTIARTIAKQKGPMALTAEDVRKALFNLLWRSHLYVSQCVAAQMVAVARCFDPVLSDDEQRDYRNWYLRNPWIAELSPMVLHGRIELLITTLGILSDEPELGDLPWQAFLRSLIWKTQMIEVRRDVERARKQKRGRR